MVQKLLAFQKSRHKFVPFYMPSYFLYNIETRMARQMAQICADFFKLSISFDLSALKKSRHKFVPFYTPSYFLYNIGTRMARQMAQICADFFEF